MHLGLSEAPTRMGMLTGTRARKPQHRQHLTSHICSWKKRRSFSISSAISAPLTSVRIMPCSRACSFFSFSILVLRGGKARIARTPLSTRSRLDGLTGYGRPRASHRQGSSLTYGKENECLVTEMSSSAFLKCLLNKAFRSTHAVPDQAPGRQSRLLQPRRPVWRPASGPQGTARAVTVPTARACPCSPLCPLHASLGEVLPGTGSVLEKKSYLSSSSDPGLCDTNSPTRTHGRTSDDDWPG